MGEESCNYPDWWSHPPPAICWRQVSIPLLALHPQLLLMQICINTEVRMHFHPHLSEDAKSGISDSLSCNSFHSKRFENKLFVKFTLFLFEFCGVFNIFYSFQDQDDAKSKKTGSILYSFTRYALKTSYSCSSYRQNAQKLLFVKFALFLFEFIPDIVLIHKKTINLFVKFILFLFEFILDIVLIPILYRNALGSCCL